MTANAISPSGKFGTEYKLAMARAGGRCMAYPKIDARCMSRPTEVWFVEGKMIALCRDCRRNGIGLSAQEKRVASREFRAKQLSLFNVERQSK